MHCVGRLTASIGVGTARSFQNLVDGQNGGEEGYIVYSLVKRTVNCIYFSNNES